MHESPLYRNSDKNNYRISLLGLEVVPGLVSIGLALKKQQGGIALGNNLFVFLLSLTEPVSPIAAVQNPTLATVAASLYPFGSTLKLRARDACFR
jgi:hypothetical protein